jgi:hypothetical protein
MGRELRSFKAGILAGCLQDDRALAWALGAGKDEVKNRELSWWLVEVTAERREKLR